MGFELQKLIKKLLKDSWHNSWCTWLLEIDCHSFTFYLHCFESQQSPWSDLCVSNRVQR